MIKVRTGGVIPAGIPDKRQKTYDTRETWDEEEQWPMEEEVQEEPLEVIEEKEEDAKRDSSVKIKDTVTFLTPDTTMNIMPCTMGNMLVTVSEGGLQHLVAGARANVGVKSGRYMFEAKIIEQMNPLDEGSRKPSMFARNVLRIGFSAEGSSLFLGDENNTICFDNEGNMVSQRKKTKTHRPFKSGVIVAVVVNLEEKSPNFNTVSLFVDGVRACEPQPIPEGMKGATLFPAISFKNITVHSNFAAPIVPLSFKCKSISEATMKDAVVKTYPQPEDGKYTVLFPVSMPDSGSFDWLDHYLEKHPEFTELSQRAVIAWAARSGLTTLKLKRVSNDRPEINIGTPAFDDMSILAMLTQLAILQPRNFVVMEVKGNLIKEERIAALSTFKMPMFKSVVDIIVGEPPASFKARTQAHALKVKQEAADAHFRIQKLEEKKQWMLRIKVKQQEKMKAKLEKERKKKAADLKKKWEATLRANAKKKAADEAGEEQEEEEEAEAEEEAEEIESEQEAEPAEESSPKVELTDEEKQQSFIKHASTDLTEYVMNTSFMNFTLPAADEGFDAMKYSWFKKDKAPDHLKQWVFEKKLTTRVEDITPSDWFYKKHQEWQGLMQGWKTKQNEYKGVVARKTAEKAAAVAAKAAAEQRAKAIALMKAKRAEAEKAKEEEEEKEGESPKKGEKKQEEEEEGKAMETEEAVEEEEEEEVVDFDAVDVFGVADVTNMGASMPLFKEFQFEDWAMTTLRFEMHLLAHAFCKDANDSDLTGMHLDHVSFYYQKYYGKALNFKAFGMEGAKELLDLIDDTVWVTKSIVEPQIPAELESNTIFVRLVEEARRYRGLMIDLGKEEAKLKIVKVGDGLMGMAQKQWAQADNQGQSWSSGGQSQQQWGNWKQGSGWNSSSSW